MARSARPNLSARFRAQIDAHVNGGGGWNSTPNLPADVLAVSGTVTDRTITAIMRDGTRWTWTGGRYADRKVNLCYAPLMPKPEAGPIAADRGPVADVRAGATVLVNGSVRKVARVVHAAPDGPVVMVRLHAASGAVIYGATPSCLVTVVVPAPAHAPEPEAPDLAA